MTGRDFQALIMRLQIGGTETFSVEMQRRQQRVNVLLVQNLVPAAVAEDCAVISAEENQNLIALLVIIGRLLDAAGDLLEEDKRLFDSFGRSITQMKQKLEQERSPE